MNLIDFYGLYGDMLLQWQKLHARNGPNRNKCCKSLYMKGHYDTALIGV